MTTRIVVGKPFHTAEAYHQKWRLRRHPVLFDALLRNYDSEPQLLASTAAAKLNAYVAGHWPQGHLTHSLDQLGLSPSGRDYALRMG